MNSLKKTARMAGFLYLVFMVTLIFSSVVRSNLIVFGDAAATANNIMASEGLFRLSIVSDSIVFLIEIQVVRVGAVYFFRDLGTMSTVSAGKINSSYSRRSYEGQYILANGSRLRVSMSMFS